MVWQSPVALVLVVTIDVICAVWMLVYSYVVYRNDPHRTSPAGTSPGSDEQAA
jgi:hypothetical protein